MTLFEDLKQRGLVYDASPEVERALAEGPLTGYIGFDPTADSLHVGSLLPIMGLARMQRHGHHAVALVGGGTGMIGDPSGKSHERTLMTREQVEHNVAGIREQLRPFLDFDHPTNPARLANNADWLLELSMMEMLRDVGKHFTVNYMLAKESVKSRMAQDEGISFTEFSYMILQAYDYLVLHDRLGCTLQMGGSDQWGNITAGTELIRRLRGNKAHGLVFPLVTDSAGKKFGKTEQGTIWLDAARTSPYRFYQFWLNTSDQDVIRYLNYFTWLEPDAIAGLATALAEDPAAREAQRTLAREVTALVHGDAALTAAERASRVLFGEEFEELDAAQLLDIFSEVPSTELPRAQLEGTGLGIVELLTATGIARGNKDARRQIEAGGIYLNNRRVTDSEQPVGLAQSIEGQLLVLRRGKNKYHLVRLV